MSKPLDTADARPLVKDWKFAFGRGLPDQESPVSSRLVVAAAIGDLAVHQHAVDADGAAPSAARTSPCR